MAEQVKLPKAMLDHLEEQALEYSNLKEGLKAVADALAGYKVKAVITEPPSGRDALRITDAIITLVNLAKS